MRTINILYVPFASRCWLTQLNAQSVSMHFAKSVQKHGKLKTADVPSTDVRTPHTKMRDTAVLTSLSTSEPTLNLVH